MPAMKVAEFRISDEQRAHVTQQADRHGVSFSEYVRQSIAFTLGWAAALDTVSAGANPRDLTDLERVAHLLAIVSGASPAPP